MGMVMGLVTVRDSTVQRLLADPPLAWALIAREDSEGEELELLEGEGRELDLDKSWHGIHYLFTGSAWEGEPPLNFLVSGGEPIGDVDVGYGPARALTSQQVVQVHRALTAISDEAIRSRFHPRAMMKAEIYPEIWDRPADEEDTLGFLMEYLDKLRAYVASAAADGLGIVASLS